MHSIHEIPLDNKPSNPGESAESTFPHFFHSEEARLIRTTSGVAGQLSPRNRGKGTQAHRPIGQGAVQGSLMVHLVEKGTQHVIQNKEVVTWDGRIPIRDLCAEWKVKV